MVKSAFIIGLFLTLVTLFVGVYMFLASDVIGTATYTIYAKVKNANGLLIDGSVNVSGVKIGRIKNIVLENNQAKLILEIEKKIELHEEDILTRVPKGILGSVVLEIERTQTGKLLQDKDYLINVDNDTLMETLTNSSQEIIKDVDYVTGEIQNYLASSDLLARIDEITEYLATTTKDISLITQELAINSQFNAQNIQTMIQAIAGITVALEQFLTTDKTLNNQEFADTLIAIKNSLQNIQEITDGISQGEGTIGKLLKDETLYTQTATAVENINKVTRRAAGLYTDFEYRYEGLIAESTLQYTSRNNVNLRINPADSPRYYQVGITTGGPENFVNTPDYTSNFVNDTTKINLLFAQRFGKMLTVRGGLLENTGGFGIDFTPIPQLQISGEAFDFGGGKSGIQLRSNIYIYPFFDPRELRNPLKWIYIGGGVDDILESYKRNYYFSLGIRIQDEFIYDAIRLLPLASATTTIR